MVPGPDERAWLAQKYPASWPAYDRVWQNVTARWSEADLGNDFAVHGTSIIGFCDLCQLVLCQGTPSQNTARTLERDGRKHIFCSEPCEHIFSQQPERYAAHKDVVKRVLAGEAPANLIALVQRYFGLRYETWGKDASQGDYPWLTRPTR